MALLQRRVAEQVGDGADHLRLDASSRSSAPRPRRSCARARSARRRSGRSRGADQVAHRGAAPAPRSARCRRRRDRRSGCARRSACARACSSRRHSSARTASSALRPRCGAAAAWEARPCEGEVDARVGERQRLVHAGEGGRVPGDGDVHIVEGAGAHHEALGGAALLGRAAVVAHAARAARSRRASPSPRWRRAARRSRAGCGRSHGRRRRPAAAACSATPASWLRPGSASYSPRMAMTGPPSPASPITAVGMPATLARHAEALAPPAWRCARRRSGARHRRVPACPRCGR